MDEEHRDPETDDEVAQLLRRIPPRPPVPAAIAARAREAAEGEWRQLARRRTRRRFAGYAAAALAAGIAVAWTAMDRHPAPTPGPPAALPAGPLAVVETIRGTVTAAPSLDAAAEAVAAGGELGAGVFLETADDGRAALRLAGGQSLRLDLATRVELVSPKVLHLRRGAVYVDSGAAPTALEVRTPLGVARDLGTQFEVRLDAGAMRVRVREGAVRVEHGGDTHQADAGDELSIDPSGTADRRRVSGYGPQWRWQLEVAPPFELEGSSLADYLAWVGRETGWRVRFDDPALTGYAATVELHGALDGIPPDRTPALVLPTCGLTHRLEAGVLTVFEPQT